MECMRVHILEEHAQNTMAHGELKTCGSCRGHNVDERGVDAEEFERDVELAGKRRNIKLYNRLITK